MSDIPEVDSEAEHLQRPLSSRAARGAAHMVGGQVVRFTLQALNLILLARVLTDVDFGVFAMSWAIIGIGHIVKDAGLATAAVQALRVSPAQRSNLFWMNAGIGLALTMAGFLIAPILAVLYRNPDVLGVTLGLAPTIFLASLTTQYRASFARQLRVGALTAVDISCGFLGLAAGVAAALSGWGAQALVLQQLAGGVFSLIGISVLAGWIPKRYDRGVPMGQFWRIGGGYFISQLFHYVGNNADTVIMGILHSPSTTGLYNRAVQLARVPLNQFRGPLDQVGVAALSKVQSEKEILVRYVNSANVVVVYPVLALAAFAVAAAPVMVPLVLGERWTAAVPYLQLLIAGEAMSTLAGGANWIFSAMGIAGSLARFTAWATCIRIAVMAAMGFLGPHGVAIGFFVSHCVMWVVSLLIVRRVSGVETRTLIEQGVRAILIWAPAAGLGFIAGLRTSDWAPWPSLTAIAAGVMAFPGVAMLVPVVRREVLQVIRTVKRLV
ncbi:oligosaccharide flippase family protein [Sinomonas flava]|uniref:Lipopolysaccharide biosynthesis protein n=1 Tax=Sinomonas flava TaxID=496857 RepID=A0ABN3BPW2_9MICC